MNTGKESSNTYGDDRVRLMVRHDFQTFGYLAGKRVVVE